MNLREIKHGFEKYLINKQQQENFFTKKSVEELDTSIFSNMDEFSEYVEKELDLDPEEVLQNLDILSELEVEEGHLVNPDEASVSEEASVSDEASISEEVEVSSSDEVEVDEEVEVGDKKTSGVDIFNDTDEYVQSMEDKTGYEADDIKKKMYKLKNLEVVDGQLVDTKDTSRNSKTEDIVVDTLNELLKDETFADFIDRDENGEVDKQDILDFYEAIKEYDKDSGSISLEDIASALKDIKNGEFLYADEREEIEAAQKEAKLAQRKAEREAQAAAAQAAQAAQSAGGASGGGGVSGGGGASSGGGVSGGGASGGTSNLSNDTNSLDNLSVEELEKQKTAKEGELETAQDDVNKVHNGENEAVKKAKEDCDKAKEEYDKALEEDEKVSDELKEKRDTNLEAIAEKESEIDDSNIKINDKKGEISKQESTISSTESNLSAMKSSLSALKGQKSDDADKQAEIQSKISALESQIKETEAQLEKEKETLQTMKTELGDLEETLKTQEGELEKLNTEKDEIDKEILACCGEETKKALEAYNTAKENVDKTKTTELEKANEVVTTKQTELNDIVKKLDEAKAEEIKKENSVSNFDFDFDEKLIGNQAADLEKFKQLYAQNEAKYKEVERQTGVPAELVAALHWRESGGNFNTYLHNGDPLGKPTVHVPRGVMFNDWTAAAVDALKNHGGDISSIDKNDVKTYYEYAERYNGLGYRNKGVPSPYVWAGTTNYSGGKYVADGVYDPNHVDKQLGVAIMLKALMS